MEININMPRSIQICKGNKVHDKDGDFDEWKKYRLNA
jgi:hypothetical protein